MPSRVAWRKDPKMFEIIRKHIRWLLGFVLLLIIPSFILFGVDGYTRMTDGTNAAVAEVDGQKITRAEWDAEHRRVVERRLREDPEVTVASLDTPQARRATLDAMIQQRVLQAAALRLNLLPADPRLQRLFTTDPQFSALRNPDGTVNRDLLALQGLSSEVFVQRLRQDLGLQQVVRGVLETTILPESVAARSVEPLMQRREVQIERLDPAAFRARVQVTDEMLVAYHEANAASFRTPEEADIEYVVLDLEALTRGLTLSAEDLERHYEQNIARYTRAEERRASHILVASGADRSAAERQQARERAEALLAEVRRNPGSFAAVARRASEDPGSAPLGGDLDWFGRGGMVKPFEDAVYAMQTGEISSVIETEFGFHVISLTGVRGGERTPFAQVRQQIEAEVKRDLAQRRYAEAAETFTNTVFEQSDSLDPVIDRLALTRRTATVQRNPTPGAAGALASARLLESVFGPEALTNKRNTEAVEIGSSQLASARVLAHRPARAQTLDEVRPLVRERVLAREAAALARTEGEKRLAALRERPDEALPIQVTLSRMLSQGAPQSLMDAALGADASALPALKGVDLGENGYLVVRVVRVLPHEAMPGGDDPLRQQIAMAWANAETEAYLDVLKRRFKAEVKPSAERSATTP
jgi:peptidyl-prolyl cis-trans isomerase D